MPILEIDKKDLEKLVKKVNSYNGLDISVGHAMGNWLMRQAENRIRKTKVTPKGEAWKDSVRSVVLGRDKLMYDTGNLLRSMGYSLKDWRKGFLIIDNKAGYSAPLQYGSTKKNITARPFLGITKDDKKILSQQIEKYIIKKLN